MRPNWIKLEVIGDEYSLQPDVFGLVEAAAELVKRGFHRLPLHHRGSGGGQAACGDAGCSILMPWGAPIGTGKGLVNPYALYRQLRHAFPDIPLIVDAGIGTPSHAAQAHGAGL